MRNQPNSGASTRREVDQAEADFFDAVVAAVTGLTDAMKAETDALAKGEASIGKLAIREKFSVNGGKYLLLPFGWFTVVQGLRLRREQL